MGAGRSKDRKGRPLVAITGMGVVTSLGEGRDANWAALCAGRSGIHAIRRFSTEGLRTRIAGTIDFVKVDPACAPQLSETLATRAIEEALSQARIGRRGDFPGTLTVAVPPVEMEWPQREAMVADLPQGAEAGYAELLQAAASRRFEAFYDLFAFAGVAERLAERFGTKGAPISLSTACSSGATAIQLGVEAIRRGETAAALCVATDGSVHAEALIRFSLLSALSTQNDPAEGAAKPFAKNRDGFVMGEGAAALVLEDYDAAKSRGAKVLGFLLGAGDRGDGFHRTRSSPDGKPIILALRDAIEDAGLAPDEIDSVNAHGTGTPENDKMESLGCAHVFGERAKRLPTTSNKSMIGHTLTAAGAVEAVFSMLSIQTGRIPPTINYAVPDPAITLDIVANAARDVPVGTVISNSFGFGGQNTCLVFGAEPKAA